MKKSVWLISILLLLLLPGKIISADGNNQAQKKDFTEPSEKKHNEWQPPVKIMDAIGLEPGMTIADIGAGGGRFTVWFADRVGEKGKVYANEIKTDLLFYIARRCNQHGFKNVILRRGTKIRPNIPEGSLDIAFMIDVYHHLEEKEVFLMNLASTLKLEGMVVIVENDPEKSGWTTHMTPRDILIREMQQFGYTLVKMDPVLTNDTIYFFRAKK